MKLASLRRVLICGTCSWLIWATPSQARFLQADPIGYDDQVNLYAYVGNDPVNKYDPEGAWSREVHNHIFQLAVGSRLTYEGRSIVRSASLFQDLPGAGNYARNYMHYLRDRGETVTQARDRYQNFVSRQVELGRRAVTVGEEGRALAIFARAAHAVQDSYSPAHQVNGVPQEYEGVISQGHSPLDIMGQEGTNDLTPEVTGAMVRDTRTVFNQIFDTRTWDRPRVWCIGSRIERTSC